MIDYNPCQGCDFFNKPYWSIVSPCANCHKRATGGFVTTTITNVPSAEYAPVRHGRWVKRGQDIFCSECDEESGYTWAGASRYSDYCPNCGAKMDLEK